MSDPVLMEEALQFGAGGRLSGILTWPSVPVREAQELPIFVFLNAGGLHRVGPHRLYVRLARDLSTIGFSSLRVDLAGRGDSAARPGLPYQQSIAADYDEILDILDSRVGRVQLILAGLCSGADDAIRLAPKDPRIVGLVLMDPVCCRDDRFELRAAVQKYTSASRYVEFLKRRFESPTTNPRGGEDEVDLLSLRDSPTQEQLRSAFESICEREGRVLSVFTQYALGYYNVEGQLGRVVGVNGYQQFCTELFWPQAEHTYTLELHRRRLINEIKNWASEYIRSHSLVHERQAL
jgi:hypothetical protein